MFQLQSFWQRISGGPREKQALAFLRIALGLFFLYQGHHKLTNPQFSSNLADILQGWAAQNPIGFYQAFLTHVAAPYAELFAFLVTYGEIFVGLSYVLGFLVQFSAPAAAFMNLNFLLATQHNGPAQLGINLAFLLVSLAMFWGRAGQHFGFDAYVFRPADTCKPKAVKSSKKLQAAQDMIASAQKSRASARRKNKPKSKPF